MNESRKTTRVTLSKRHVLALVVAVVCASGLSGDCPGSSDNPCVDGVLGGGLLDSDGEGMVAVRLTNRSEDYVHLIGWREEPDLCNRVNDRGGYRFMFVSAEYISFRVRAYRDGELLDEIVCELSGDVAEVVYTDTRGLACVDFGG
jgi:hypothetical protein